MGWMINVNSNVRGVTKKSAGKWDLVIMIMMIIQ